MKSILLTIVHSYFYTLRTSINCWKTCLWIARNLPGEHEILYEFQYGFRKCLSTIEIVEIADNLRKAIDSNQYSCGVFLDFQGFWHRESRYSTKKLELRGIN